MPGRSGRGGCRVREKTYKRAFEWALDAAHLSDDGDHSYPAPIPACVCVCVCVRGPVPPLARLSWRPKTATRSRPCTHEKKPERAAPAKRSTFQKGYRRDQGVRVCSTRRHHKTPSRRSKTTAQSDQRLPRTTSRAHSPAKPMRLTSPPPRSICLLLTPPAA